MKKTDFKRERLAYVGEEPRITDKEIYDKAEKSCDRVLLKWPDYDRKTWTSSALFCLYKGHIQYSRYQSYELGSVG